MGDLKTGLQTAFVRFSLERLATFGSFVWKEIGLIRGAEENLRKLHRTFLRIQFLLDNIDGSLLRFSGGDRGKAWQMLFEDLRKLAYDADSLLDRVFLHLHSYCSRRAIEGIDQTQLMSMITSSLQDLNLPHKISDMQNKLDELTKELEAIRMVEKTNEDSCTRLTNFHSTSSIMKSEHVVGRENAKSCILAFLGEKCDKSNLSVTSLVGMAGIGKTTLAQLVYNDDDVRYRFDKRIWVSVSMDFDLVRITKAMIEAATLSVCNLSDLNSLQLALEQILLQKKVLLVLDDYWRDSRDDWDLLCLPFQSWAKGSKIIVTVSSIVSSFEACKLDILSDDDCWELLKRRTMIDIGKNSNLESIGRSISKKCKGLPLVAMSVGSLLHRKTLENEWRSVLGTDFWDMPDIFPIMIRSYIDLPVHLKKCFGYCSIFPQNHQFEVNEIVLLWMAEGFIETVEGMKLEDVGRMYFEDLCSRSFFQPFGNASDQYKMHDFIHDMAQMVSKDLCSHLTYNMSSFYNLFGSFCHLSVLLNDDSQPIELKVTKNERLRTLLVTHADDFHELEIDDDMFSDIQFLRVLGLQGLKLTEVPDSIEKLEYLRYLDLSRNSIEYVPGEICNFVALQTLKLNNCLLLAYLPNDIWKLTNLRHLDLGMGENCNLRYMPVRIGELIGLQTLSVYIVGRDENEAGIEELKNLNGLRGSLCIKHIDRVSNEKEAAEAMLDMKTCLDKLELHWGSLHHQADMRLKEEQARILSKLKPHENLKELALINYYGNVYPSWLDQPWRKFTRIELHGLKLDHLPSLGQLPSLKYFGIFEMPNVKNIDDSFYGTGDGARFPSLEFFKLEKMTLLVEWKNATSNNVIMPCLNAFEIDDCPNLTNLPPNLLSFIPKSSITNCPNLEEHLRAV